MIIIDESEAPGSHNERSPLKGGDQSPTTPFVAAPPPPYAPALAPASIPSYQAIPDQDVEQQASEDGHSHHRGSHRGRWRGGRGRRGRRSRSGSPRPQRSAFRRFTRAFLVAVFVIIVWGAFVDSIDMIFRTSGSRRRHGLFSGSRWLVTWYGNPTVVPNPCPCPGQSIPTMPGRILPVQYPPVASKSATPSPLVQYIADTSQIRES